MQRGKKTVLKKILNNLEKVEKYLGKWKKHLVASYGIVLFVFSILFCIYYKLIIFDPVLFLPPITSIVIWIGFFAMLLLMFKKERVGLIFGENSESRKNILHILGVIFTAFILMITLLWSIPGALHPNVLYWQSYLLVGLFFFIAGSFYCILDEL